MISTVARCPYCGAVAAGLDAHRAALALAPDRAGGRVCDHLAFVSVGRDVWPRGGDARVPGRNGQWLWVRREGLRVSGTRPAGPLVMYVNEIACELLPSAQYRIGGGTEYEREEARRGGGSPRLPAKT